MWTSCLNFTDDYSDPLTLSNYTFFNQRGNHHMQVYKNLNGNSGIQAYEFNQGSIIVAFKTGGSYLYTNESAGAAHISEMHRLAQLGKGLNTYINQNTHMAYAKDLRAD